MQGMSQLDFVQWAAFGGMAECQPAVITAAAASEPWACAVSPYAADCCNGLPNPLHEHAGAGCHRSQGAGRAVKHLMRVPHGDIDLATRTRCSAAARRRSCSAPENTNGHAPLATDGSTPVGIAFRPVAEPKALCDLHQQVGAAQAISQPVAATQRHQRPVVHTGAGHSTAVGSEAELLASANAAKCAPHSVAQVASARPRAISDKLVVGMYKDNAPRGTAAQSKPRSFARQAAPAGTQAMPLAQVQKAAVSHSQQEALTDAQFAAAAVRALQQKQLSSQQHVLHLPANGVNNIADDLRTQDDTLPSRAPALPAAEQAVPAGAPTTPEALPAAGTPAWCKLSDSELSDALSPPVHQPSGTAVNQTLDAATVDKDLQAAGKTATQQQPTAQAGAADLAATGAMADLQACASAAMHAARSARQTASTSKPAPRIASAAQTKEKRPIARQLTTSVARTLSRSGATAADRQTHALYGDASVLAPADGPQPAGVARRQRHAAVARATLKATPESAAHSAQEATESAPRAGVASVAAQADAARPAGTGANTVMTGVQAPRPLRATQVAGTPGLALAEAGTSRNASAATALAQAHAAPNLALPIHSPAHLMPQAHQDLLEARRGCLTEPSDSRQSPWPHHKAARAPLHPMQATPHDASHLASATQAGSTSRRKAKQATAVTGAPEAAHNPGAASERAQPQRRMTCVSEVDVALLACCSSLLSCCPVFVVADRLHK